MLLFVEVCIKINILKTLGKGHNNGHSTITIDDADTSHQ